MYLNVSFNTIVTALHKGLPENFGAAIISLALEGCLYSIDVQQMLGSFLFSSLTSKLNLFLRNVV